MTKIRIRLSAGCGEQTVDAPDTPEVRAAVQRAKVACDADRDGTVEVGSPDDTPEGSDGHDDMDAETAIDWILTWACIGR